ncbi:poly(glycerol-phosphate) alpha-glucosyltransferase [Listeria welshimeri]|uniref:poly(glycerol-phosphate) alpha-glucosyltransferase n=1 Tax=Listeria welshimeri TaxID=1643 RepID=UPI00162955A9|nr:poly(glycerol-phosphate) alpha-glucosyltransferase [Listeria welshimeri]MBC1410566.1 poly(glycerol-phosphate) alpha-glucosyltransferase [Listeria welshimeri]MBC1455214.1 poly(glycerol-phosphate) alpha-glucosyltransferase [Listeria welshimeri]MBC1462204.1 poly(glycerol-phosphate) alpha-glucosyltransferase [Listeria welshimeri]MBC1467550.1 poly(glycerol-phosphate) alpha-glucosyltransferase [Listeria welshimeri]MBC1640076.1 poly(glycerol-phosphate) alpha-glucosyltransferase [Listeria welshimer
MPWRGILDELENKIIDQMTEAEEHATYNGKWHGFLTIGYKNKRATVINFSYLCLANLINEMKKSALKNQTDEAISFKMDIAVNYQLENLGEWNRKALKTKKNYYRRGIALNENFKMALMEQEINANAILLPADEGLAINIENMNRYLMQSNKNQAQLNLTTDSNIVTFDTVGWFFDGKKIHELETTEWNHGRRKTTLLKPEIVAELVGNAGRYLANQVNATGEFNYGWFACFDKKIKHYNSLRHASTTYSMLEAYELTEDEFILEAAANALAYLQKNFIYEKEDLAFLIEPELREVKLGGAAATLLAFTKYMKITGNKTYLPLCRKIANAILSLQDKDGKFTHVLEYPTLEVKDIFRIVYYDGEAVFGLLRLYEIDRDSRWLDAAAKSFNHFIRDNYWQNHDHWLSYCANEITKYIPDEAYYEFGLQNAFDNLPFIYARETTFPTFLELTVATKEMTLRMEKEGLQHLLLDYSIEELEKTITKRAHYQLNGYFYPELAMYYKNPARIEGSFFIRHQSFRVRIDDVEHNISGYVRYYQLLKHGKIRVETETVQ